MKYIHLLYVPTMACNMRCSYCYLGEHTRDDNACPYSPVETLQYAVEKLHEAEVVPYNISLHGGEVTTLPVRDFQALTEYIGHYYQQHRLLLKNFGAAPSAPHIKTNLYHLDRHLKAIADQSVTVSGSLDLPLFLHRKHRRGKNGEDTLDRILENIEKLRELPGRKKVSATIFHEHMVYLDEIVEDIRWLHQHTCLDMNDFNFMIGFRSPDAVQALTPLSEAEQLLLFERMHEAFEGSDLHKGLHGAWFAEFGPEYCTNCTNCGEKFFLLERSGDIYSCVRGQGHPAFYFGNIYQDSVDTILQNAEARIREAHASVPFEPECGGCEWFDLCKTGCPFVKRINQSGFSYTCKLQKRLYERDYPGRTPSENAAYEYLLKMRPEEALPYYREPEYGPDGMISLTKMIADDPRLQMVYDPDAFILQCDGQDYAMESQILKRERTTLFCTPATEMILYMRRDVLSKLSQWPMHNALYIMLLDGRTIVYGDEQREKQAHVVTLQLHGYALEQLPGDREGYYRIPLKQMLSPYLDLVGREKPCNLFFTTSALRDYHYAKQKENAYYHLQAINLPFANIEFTYVNIPTQPRRTPEQGL
ncbi:MAG: radical SAM protein [Clostridia bacterium]|nr:radical SAM protein [Clostridia bacterium]